MAWRPNLLHRMPGFEGRSALRGVVGTRTVSAETVGMSLKADIDPPPTTWPFVPALALLAILFFVSLQFLLPVTHVRHPLDPYRTWIPVNQLPKPSKSDTRDKAISTRSDETLIVIMTKETDLRPTFVVLNSTISNTMEPEKLHFCVILPSSMSNSESLKLKAVLSNFDIEFFRDGFIMERMKTSMAAESRSEKFFKLLDVVPFYLPKIFPRYGRFVYLESDAVVQGDIQELIQLDMQGNPVAGVEDCTQVFETYFSMKLLEAVRLSVGNEKPELPAQSYEPQTCLYDKGILVIDQKVWSEKNITEAVHWWIAMYHKTAESLYSNGHLELPFHLALYEKYKKLDALWSVREPLAFARANAAKLLHFDKQHKPWHQTKPSNFEKDAAGLWWKYLSPSTNMMFNTQ